MPTEQYLSLFFSLFDAGIPWAVIGITVLMVIFASAWLYHKGRKQVLLPWIVACLFLMLYATVIGRLGSSSGSSVHLMPFWSIQAIQEGYIETMYEKIYNVLFFVPYGCLLGFRSFSNRVLGFRGFKGAVLVGFLTSVGIEFLQLITRTGTCETDDVICNTLGIVVGTMVGTFVCWLIGKIRNT